MLAGATIYRHRHPLHPNPSHPEIGSATDLVLLLFLLLLLLLLLLQLGLEAGVWRLEA
jgi:hypothetical protein